VRQAQNHELYEVARFAVVGLVNHQPGRKVQDQYKDAQDWVQFSWEKKRVQTVQEMKSILLSFAATQNRKVKKEEERLKKLKK
jgi:alpha-D-ribose 1-methylphosphonate 5-triphosphate diphosphatase PhnM